MASRKKKESTWLLAPNEIGLNRDTNMLKIVAMITMLIDHLGAVVFPQARILRVIGRMAFPIYCYCIAVGCVYSHDRLKYLLRITLMGLVSQPIYAVAMNHVSNAMRQVDFSNPALGALRFYVASWSTPNIMLTLGLGLLAAWSIREKHFVGTLAIALFVWLADARMTSSYGWKGVALIVLFYVFIRYWWLSLPAVLSYMIWWGLRGSGYSAFGFRFGTQLFAVMSLPLIYIPTQEVPAKFRPLVHLGRAAVVFIILCLLGVRLETVAIAVGLLVVTYALSEWKFKLNKWVFYLFYPGHLAVIILIRYFMGMKLL